MKNAWIFLSKGRKSEYSKVYEVDSLTCAKCQGTMKVTAFITDYAVVARIISQLKLMFITNKPSRLWSLIRSF